MNTRHRPHGVTLVELLIVVAILGILTAIAIPSYNSYIVRANRTAGTNALLDLANDMEQYYVRNNTYEGATLENVGGPESTENGLYNMEISNLSATTYTLTAVPQKNQANDTECGSFTYDQLGVKGITGSSTAKDCW